MPFRAERSGIGISRKLFIISPWPVGAGRRQAGKACVPHRYLRALGLIRWDPPMHPDARIGQVAK